MITITTLDGKKEQLEGAREIIPFQNLLISPMLRAPYVALCYYHDSILPVLGPLPKAWSTDGDYENRPWILICKDHARIIVGFPEFSKSAEAKEKLRKSA